MTDNIKTLCDQHDGLRKLATDYERQLERPEPDLDALGKCRWTLARLVSTHLAYERMYLYERLAKNGHVGSAPMARQLAELGGLLEAHVRNWTLDRIVREWSAYRRASVALIRTLRDHMDREERELYPLLLHAKAA